MFTYSGYGLNVDAPLPLSELRAGRGRADVVIRREDLGTPPVGVKRGGFEGRMYDDVLLVWGDLVTVSVRGGREMGFDCSPKADEYWLRQCLLGPALGVLLHQRGHLVLHASAVEVNGKAVVLIGHKGAGKSTTAAAMHMRGYPLLADDIVAIDHQSTSGPRVIPGVPHVKLRPDSADAVQLRKREPEASDLELEKRLSELEPVKSDLELEKRTWRMHPSKSRRVPVPLGAIYVLTEGEPVGCKDLSATETFAELVRYSYALRFTGHPRSVLAHFSAVSAATPHCAAARISRKPSLVHLSETIDLIERRCSSAC